MSGLFSLEVQLAGFADPREPAIRSQITWAASPFQPHKPVSETAPLSALMRRTDFPSAAASAEDGDQETVREDAVPVGPSAADQFLPDLLRRGITERTARRLLSRLPRSRDILRQLEWGDAAIARAIARQDLVAQLPLMDFKSIVALISSTATR
ncbi:MAG: hypothetical protein ABI868_24280 [Acidobacteriota bacterium]